MQTKTYLIKWGKYSPAIIQTMIAGREIENVDPNKILTKKMVNEQKVTFGDVSEWLYRGKNSMTKAKNSTTTTKPPTKTKTN